MKICKFPTSYEKYQLPFTDEKAGNKASVKRDKRKGELGVKTESANAFTRKTS